MYYLGLLVCGLCKSQALLFATAGEPNSIVEWLLSQAQGEGRGQTRTGPKANYPPSICLQPGGGGGVAHKDPPPVTGIEDSHDFACSS